MSESPRVTRTLEVVYKVLVIARGTIAVARSEQITFLAAAIAYYAFASVVPLVMLITVAASIVGGDSFAASIVASFESVLTPASQDVLQSTLTTTSGRGPATLIGVVVLLWSSLKVFRALDTAFSIVYGTENEHGFLETVVDGAIALGAVALAIAASTLLVSTVAISTIPFLAEITVLFQISLLTIAFYPLYVVFPDVDVSFTEAIPGTVFAATGWTITAVVFRWYVGVSGSFAVWGVLGAALIVVTWLYLGSVLILLGAALNAVLADRSAISPPAT